jgi:hypothetical protein
MKKNINNVDRILRVLIAGAIAILYFTGLISGTLAIILGILAIVLLITSLINFCPLYALLKFSTLKTSK